MSAFSGQRPGMLLSILQGTHQYPQTETYLSKVSTELSLKNPDLH